jgi:hypothetical protein
VLVQVQVRRIEEDDLAHLRIQGVDAEGLDRRALVGLGDGELELHAVGALEQAEQFRELLTGQPGRLVVGGGHDRLLQVPVPCMLPVWHPPRIHPIQVNVARCRH